MKIEERQACDLWVRSVMAEFAGRPIHVVQTPKSADGLSLFYDSREWEAMFRAIVPSIADRIIELGLRLKNLWEVWPLLTEAELGTIMQTGAAKFLKSPVQED